MLRGTGLPGSVVTCAKSLTGGEPPGPARPLQKFSTGKHQTAEKLTQVPFVTGNTGRQFNVCKWRVSEINMYEGVYLGGILIMLMSNDQHGKLLITY